MKIWMAACSKKGYEQMIKVKNLWMRQDPMTQFWTVVKCKSMPKQSIPESLSKNVKEAFFWADAMIFFCATGIAVRMVAPWILHKSKDPAVLTMDETGTFIIPLLSGHAGGANELAKRIGKMTGSLAVITTATDREHLFSVDDFARKNHLVLSDWNKAKKMSAGLLDGKEVKIFSNFYIEGEVPRQIEVCTIKSEKEKQSFLKEDVFMIVWISLDPPSKDFLKEYGEENILWLVPAAVIAGVGCRKGISYEKIDCAIYETFKEEGICIKALDLIATIDLKKEEPGLVSWCQKYKKKLCCFSSEQLQKVPGHFHSSAFVKKVTGTDNVCERSAVACGGELICGKKKKDGVTVALAKKKVRIKF